MGRPYGEWLGEYDHLPNVPKPPTPAKAPLSSTGFKEYPKAFYVVWIRETGDAQLFGTTRGANLSYDVLDVKEMKSDPSKRPTNDYVNDLLRKEGACRQYSLPPQIDSISSLN
jgi:hypothetical protein